MEYGWYRNGREYRVLNRNRACYNLFRFLCWIIQQNSNISLFEMITVTKDVCKVDTEKICIISLIKEKERMQVFNSVSFDFIFHLFNIVVLSNE